jgi:hypothetical protein
VPTLDTKDMKMLRMTDTKFCESGILLEAVVSNKAYHRSQVLAKTDQ